MQFQWNIATVVVSLQLAILCARWLQAGGSPWATPAQEALDEQHDAEIFRAVIESMQEWSRRTRRNASHRRPRAPAGVCYADVGCFHDSGVFGYLDMLPSPPQEVGTRFLLFSGPGRARGQAPIMDIPFSNLSTVWAKAIESFNNTAPTKVIVHGFGSSCSHVWVYEMRSALMAVEDCNVICVDWEAGASVPNYVRAAANTRLVGKQVALLLSGLHKHLQLPFHKIHLIGFSLGAHVAGFAGAELKNLSRITGLDPAGPLFESQDPRARLDSSDAMFVDVIHSNGENLILGGLGSWQPMGHVDFYPNGGRMQKGCSNLFVGAVSDIIWSSEVEGRSLCNHRRAYKFFTDSVSPRCHFPAFPCESYDHFLEGTCFPCTGDRRCGNMGYYADRSNGRGSLYLITRDEEPFCAHQYHVRLESVSMDPPTASYGKIQLTLIGNSDLNETFPLTQKDDEQLKTGESLTRILVPHPVLQEPTRVQILYTAYSGWWSSGLPSWSVRKVTLTDSFGKSLSVCKKELVLQSEVPVTLPLYPGECNPPRDFNDTATAAPSTVPEVLKPAEVDATQNVTRYIPTPVVQVGDEILGESTADGGHPEDPLSVLDGATPPHRRWQPLDFQDSSSNSLEDSRAFGSPLPLSAPTASASSPGNATAGVIDKRSGANSNNTRLEEKETVFTSEPTTSAPSLQYQNNFTSTESLLPEIREPVLGPKPTTLGISDDLTPRPSAVKTREISLSSSFATEDDRRVWIPSSDLNPPPLGMAQTWQHWNLAKANAEVRRIQMNNSRILLPVFYPASTPKANKRSHQPSPVTIQLLPQRLATFLAQAERYARLTFMPLQSTNTPSSETKLSKDTREEVPTQRRPKHFTTERPNQDTAVFQPRMDSDSNVQVLVPFSYSYKDDKKRDKQQQYIPVQYPTGGAPQEHMSEIITITPEDLKKNFRSVKIERSTSENPAVVLIDGATDYARFRPVYSREKER